MEIGERIRKLRLEKMMTQADLAKERITRNMLCSIERGTALPSLPTACYLADRLNVPVGYLLAKDSEELAYLKMSAMPDISRAFREGDHTACLLILNSKFGEKCDDEIALIRAECEYRSAREALEGGHLRRAVAGLDRALVASGKTVYETGWLRCCAAVYFRYLSRISPTLSSDVLEAVEIEEAKSQVDPFCAYIMACEAEEKGFAVEVTNYIEKNENTVYGLRLSALCMMKRGEYGKAKQSYEALLSREDLAIGVLMYEIFGDMEICCRKSDDYKRAYEYASSRMGLLERLLEES